MHFNKLFTSIFILAISLGCESDSGMNPSGGTGQGGSMTRFAISGNYLYLVDHTNIKVFSIENGQFEQLKDFFAGWTIETIFAKGDYLYLGASDAMHIYSITDPAQPSFIFRYQHIVSCDPVVVQGNRAYVTLRSGSPVCNRGVNALEIIDISNPYEPKLIKNYPMASPYGLGIHDNLLFVCQGEKGLTVLDVTQEQDLQIILQRDDFFAYDVIVKEGLATVTGEDGIFQFSYAGDSNQIQLISQIPVHREDR